VESIFRTLPAREFHDTGQSAASRITNGFESASGKFEVRSFVAGGWNPDLTDQSGSTSHGVVLWCDPPRD
jgi:hypothetical protein